MLDTHARSLTDRAGAGVQPARAECDPPHPLVRRAGSVLGRGPPPEGVGPRSWSPNDRSIDVPVRRLRRKIAVRPRRPRPIRTVRGTGHLFRAGPSAGALR